MIINRTNQKQIMSHLSHFIWCFFLYIHLNPDKKQDSKKQNRYFFIYDKHRQHWSRMTSRRPSSTNDVLRDMIKKYLCFVFLVLFFIWVMMIEEQHLKRLTSLFLNRFYLLVLKSLVDTILQITYKLIHSTNVFDNDRIP